MEIDLPKDAAGREIPLDTEVLYTEDGKRLDGSIFQRLADLIDRPDNPTCRNLSNGYRSFHCSRCGYKAFTYGDSDCDPEDFSYCPECRAERMAICDSNNYEVDCYTLMIIDFLKSFGVEVEDGTAH